MSDWNVLHQDPRHLLRYPSEHVVRFLAGRKVGRAVDIGCGAGRHVRLLQDFTADITCCDLSPAGLRECYSHTLIQGDVASCSALPYPADTFDTAIAYGVFYYGGVEHHRRSALELHRILKPGGSALVKTRTSRDWRVGHMQAGRFVCAGEPEDGMNMHFLHERDVGDLYRAFRFVDYEFTKTTSHERKRMNSDWLITVTK